MPILDDVIDFSCPAECGQLAVPCSLRMILNNEVFFCDACGFEFQLSEFPQWPLNASCAREHNDSPVKEMIRAVSAYLYAGGPCPSENIISQLLQEEPALWKLFPTDKLPASDLLNLLRNKEFSAEFDFALLDGTKIAELLSLAPEYTDKCDLTRLTTGNWLYLILKQPQFSEKCPWETLVAYIISHPASAGNMPQDWQKIFKYFPYQTDNRFQKKAFRNAETRNIPGNIGDFFAVVDFFNFYKHVAWKLFTPADLLSAAKKYHRILHNYPFNNNNLVNFDWNSFAFSDWEALFSATGIPPVLLPVFELGTGKRVVTNLKTYPKLAPYCNWSKLKSKDWTALLTEFPQESIYCEKCDWNKLTPAAWDKILQDGRNAFALAVHNALNGKKILALFKNHPAAKPYIAWEKIAVPDWFDLLAMDQQLAEHCPWQKVAEYILTLPEEQRESVKTVRRRLWKKRTELLSFVDFSKLQALPIEHYYTILNFFDWDNKIDCNSLSRRERIDLLVKHPQFAEKFGYENLSSSEKTDIALRSQEFCKLYGWNNFTCEEISRIIASDIDYLTCFEKNCSSRKWRELVNADSDIASRYKLSFFDYLFYRKFTSEELQSKISRSWHFYISIAGFFSVAWLLHDGPCGSAAFSRQTNSEMLLPGVIFISGAFLWSRLHARLFSGFVSFWYTVISALSGVLLAAMQWYYTFFLSVLSVKNYICWGIAALALLIMLGDRKNRRCNDFDNIKGLKRLMMVYLPAMLATFLICHPFSRKQMLDLSEQLRNSSRPFYSAADHYQKKAVCNPKR